MKVRLHAVALGALAVLAFARAPVSAQEAKASGSYGSDEAAVKKGKSLFTARGCFGCHTIGKGKSAGPDLAGVTERREVAWLQHWLKAPDEMLGSDPIAQEMLKEYKNVKMPNMKLKDDEIEALMHYMAAESQKVKK
jgi:mono/diheme cytochrome c family protein